MAGFPFFRYDPFDEVTAIIDPLGNQTSFTYDGNGNRLTVTDANQHTTTYTYDNMDRPITRTDPLGNQSSVKYDLSGNLIQSTDRKGQVTTYAYDGLNRATGVTYADGSTVSHTLDAGNRLTAIADSLSGTISRSCDGLDRLLSETTPQGAVGYTYDADGRRQTMTVAGQTPVSYAFDNASRLTAITQGASSVSFAYDSDGRRTSLTLPNGIVASYSYDAGSQLTAINYQGGALGAQNLIYGYDLDGRRVSMSGSLASTQLPAAVSSSSYNANNQLVSWGGTAMTYDANGNTLSDGTNTYAWDARNWLVSADNGGAGFSYDPLGRRVSKTILSTTTNFFYDGANAVEESGTNGTASLLTGGVDERFQRTDASGTYDYLTDALGSTVELTDTTGATQEQYSYGPYGVLSATGATTSNSYTYTGRESDGLGIDYYRARYYNPQTGRFISEDPTEFAGGDANLYRYAGNDPIDSIDPFGTDKKKWACTADAAINLGLGFIPGFNALKLGLTLGGVNTNFVQWGLGYSNILSSNITPMTIPAGFSSGYALYANASFEAAGGTSALERATELVNRTGFALKSARSQANLLRDLENLENLEKAASSAGTVMNLLNAASTAYDIYNCWNNKP